MDMPNLEAKFKRERAYGKERFHSRLDAGPPQEVASAGRQVPWEIRT